MARTLGTSRHPEPILHVDMDAFFASVEQRDDPSLQGRPVVVGGAGGRGVVAAASYEARRFGVHSAMPMVRARRLCPDLVIVGNRGDRYAEVSRQVMAILRDVTPLVEPLSLDEAFLDVAGAVRLFGEPPQIAQMIRERVREQVDLPCSVGVGPTKSVAKLLSGKAKPDGLLHWPADEVVARLRPLPVRDLWGAGPKTVERLESFGLHTVGAIADTDLRTLQRLVGDAAGTKLHQLARGEDPRRVTTTEPAKSISAESTFDVDVDDPVILRRHVLRLSEKVGRRLRAGGHAGRTITLRVRFASFETITRSSTLPAPTDRTHDIATVATDLLDRLRLERVRVRLLGVGVSNLGDGAGAQQLTLDAGLGDGGQDGEVADDTAWRGNSTVGDPRWRELDQVADHVAERFEGLRVSYAALLDDDDDPAEPAPTADDRRVDDDGSGAEVEEASVGDDDRGERRGNG
jgi:DNA polymerase IV